MYYSFQNAFRCVSVILRIILRTEPVVLCIRCPVVTPSDGIYERILIHHPLWVAILVNGVFFGLLHCFNDGASVLAILGIVICGLSYSLVRWYTGSIWIAMGLHTMWNFTQNFLFGLPNSGLVSQVSVFHLQASTGISNLIYDYAFGVEAAIPALIADGALGIAALLLARRDGRLGELKLSYEKMAEQQE